ncbi:MAG: hypothetical protein QGG54_02450 [Gammaproteobacteria bacterium]|nr:hypothetical protein [Chromatiales bacterium]MDP6413887.1 hypothetical protein [Gammaproteobacteria bacterium]MDP6674649.1 hypothetical protein [Gammaproteobacteria bacterium]
MGSVLLRLIGVLAVLTVSAFLSGAASAGTFSIQVLETLETGAGAANLAYGLNENGTVVGQSYNSVSGAKEAVKWNSNGTIQSLGFTGLARAVNNNGIIVGETGNAALQNPNGYAFSWQGGVTTNLGTLGGAFSGAYDINDSGVITGFANIDPMGFAPAVYRTHAFKYANGTMGDLGTVWSPTGYSRGHGINDAGEVAGRASITDFDNSQKHQATWDASGTISLHNTFVGIYSTAQQINNSGMAVGLAYDSSSAFSFDRAVMWDGSAFHFMDDLGSGFGRAWSINDAGVIVGHSYETEELTDKLATVSFDGQSVIELSTLVDNLTGWSVLSNAYDVNELGQIVGYGIYNGEERAFLLSPTAVPVPAAVWLFGSALGLLSWMRRKAA